MSIRSWQAVALLTAVRSLLILVELPTQAWTTTNAISLSLGASALALMAAAAALGSRWKFMESLFGGLDRVYLTHKWLAVWALGFASFHLAFSAEVETAAAEPIWPLAPLMREHNVPPANLRHEYFELR